MPALGFRDTRCSDVPAAWTCRLEQPHHFVGTGSMVLQIFMLSRSESYSRRVFKFLDCPLPQNVPLHPIPPLSTPLPTTCSQHKFSLSSSHFSTSFSHTLSTQSAFAVSLLRFLLSSPTFGSSCRPDVVTATFPSMKLTRSTEPWCGYSRTISALPTLRLWVPSMVTAMAF